MVTDTLLNVPEEDELVVSSANLVDLVEIRPQDQPNPAITAAITELGLLLKGWLDRNEGFAVCACYTTKNPATSELEPVEVLTPMSKNASIFLLAGGIQAMLGDTNIPLLKKN